MTKKFAAFLLAVAALPALSHQAAPREPFKAAPWTVAFKSATLDAYRKVMSDQKSGISRRVRTEGMGLACGLKDQMQRFMDAKNRSDEQLIVDSLISSEGFLELDGDQLMAAANVLGLAIVAARVSAAETTEMLLRSDPSQRAALCGAVANSLTLR